MRPFVHPAIEDITVEAVLHALPDLVRVAIYAENIEQECVADCSTFQHILAEPIPKSTLSQHIRVLREAGLIRSEHRGVEVLNSSRCAEVDARFPGLLGSIVSAYGLQMADVKTHAKRNKPRNSSR
jgi:DNA-binding transcriptional ArsR family regulator